MIAIDTNVLIHYLVRSQSEHARVRTWFASIDEPLSTTVTNLAETLRLLTHVRVFPRPMTLLAATDLLLAWLENGRVTVLQEADDWMAELRSLAGSVPSLRGNEVFDARIALCLRYNGVKRICTLDADFSKYAFLKVVAPTE